MRVLLLQYVHVYLHSPFAIFSKPFNLGVFPLHSHLQLILMWSSESRTYIIPINATTSLPPTDPKLSLPQRADDSQAGLNLNLFGAVSGALSSKSKKSTHQNPDGSSDTVEDRAEQGEPHS